MAPTTQASWRVREARRHVLRTVFLGALLAVAVLGPSACSRKAPETLRPTPSAVDQETVQRVYAPEFLESLASLPAPAAVDLSPGLKKVKIEVEGGGLYNAKAGEYQVTLDVSHQVLNLDVPKEVGFGEKEGETEADLSPSFSGYTSRARDFAPAAALALKAKQFDDGLYACVEMATDAGAGRFPAKKEFLLKLLGSLKGESDQTAAALLTAAARLGGQQPQVSPQVARQADDLQQKFLADALVSEILGFYTWSDALAQIFRRDRMLQIQIDEPTARALATALASDDKLFASYNSDLSLMEKLTNPLAWHDLRDAALALKGKHTPTFNNPTSLFPPSRSSEVDLVEKLFRDMPPPEGFSLVDEMIKRLRAGTLDLKPQPNSGWYDYQTFALEPLAIPEKMPEGEHLRFSESYRKLLAGLFKGLAALTRETHVEHLRRGVVATPAELPPPPFTISPRLSVEPLATYYLRRARSYRFVYQVVEQAFGPKALMTMQRLTAAGPVNMSLAEELRLMEALFYGAYARACQEMGMTAEPFSDSAKSQDAGASDATLRAWLNFLDKDPDLGQDIRMMVPVFYDQARGKTKVWVVLGVATTSLSVSYVTPPVIKEIKGPGGQLFQTEGAQVSFEGEDHTIEYIASAELYVSHVLNRTDFHQLCDRYKTYKEILHHLE